MEGYILDTCAWIEIFRGNNIGKEIKELLFPSMSGDGREDTYIITPSLILMEMKSTYLRQGKESYFDDDMNIIKNVTKIVDTSMDKNTSLEIGTVHGKLHSVDTRISYNDCILMNIARKENVKIISTDEHFKNFSLAVYFQKQKGD